MRNLLGSLLGAIWLVIAYPLSILLLPITRITRGEPVTFQLKVKQKAICIPDFFRIFGENLMGNDALFFSVENDDEPYYLYLPKKDIAKLPKEHLHFKHSDRSTEKEKTILLTVTTKKSILGKYLLGKIIDYKLIDEPPEKSK
ncbi:hypothetical protein [Pleionea sp. CnH1-48]|uniref:hypothetical protein n=1 Tax=Pleionea sp. CnH1-48 TaxID=2954494 RepID=UPI002096FA6B|nr:hypothetical protein [Pleionea sp. CnH1-48]MCO7226184.1 hypothetical protein [Pleionea sp. CnH1-48]